MDLLEQFFEPLRHSYYILDLLKTQTEIAGTTTCVADFVTDSVQTDRTAGGAAAPPCRAADLLGSAIQISTPFAFLEFQCP